MIRIAKNDYFEKISIRINTGQKRSSKEWWRLCKCISFGKSNIDSIPPLLYDDTMFSDDFQKANILNKYFTSISNIADADENVNIYNQPPTHNLENISITSKDVYDIIKSLKVNKASGMDGVSHRILKEAIESISEPLCKIFNKSLHQGIFPTQWKYANVIPIYKSKETFLPSNYRPVSLLSTISKVFERCVFKYLNNYLLLNEIIETNQSAFTAGDGTVNQLITIHDDICKLLDDGNDVQMIFFDISKAFDRVWHNGLLFKLEHIGICGNLIDWFKNYLSGRKQRVVIRGQSSTFLEVKSGVPQGSVLGPILFLIYINDITSGITSNKKLYADDTSLYYPIMKNREHECYQVIKRDLHYIEAWGKQWKVNFNPLKTERLLMSRKDNINIFHCDLFFQGEMIKIVDDHKHIGLTYSSNCTWKTHLNNIHSTASKRIDILKTLKWKLNRRSLEILYVSFVRPLFEYADVVWDSAPSHQYLFDNIEKLQIEAARIVTGTNRYSSKELLYRETGWLQLSTRRSIHRLNLCHKIVNGTCPRHLRTKLNEYQTHTNPYETRGQNDLYIPLCRTETLRNSFFPFTMKLWNALDESLKLSPSHEIFRIRLFNMFNPNKTKYYYYLGDRRCSAILSSLRTGCSQLNSDLFQNGLIDNKYCSCGFEETPEHYLLYCENHRYVREQFQTDTTDLGLLSVNMILHGLENNRLTDNQLLHKAVSKYILATERF